MPSSLPRPLSARPKSRDGGPSRGGLEQTERGETSTAEPTAAERELPPSAPPGPLLGASPRDSSASILLKEGGDVLGGAFPCACSVFALLIYKRFLTRGTERFWSTKLQLEHVTFLFFLFDGLQMIGWGQIFLWRARSCQRYSSTRRIRDKRKRWEFSRNSSKKTPEIHSHHFQFLSSFHKMRLHDRCPSGPARREATGNVVKAKSAGFARRGGRQREVRAGVREDRDIYFFTL